MARRLSTIAGFVGLACVLALLSVPTAVAAPTRPQTVTFTSAVPEDEDWFNSPMLVVLRQTSWPGRKRTFRATLVVPVAWNHWGYLPGQVVTFSLAGRPVCSGTTNASGLATCTATLSLRDWLRYAFVASYAGDGRYKPVALKGPTVGDRDPVQNEPW